MSQHGMLTTVGYQLGPHKPVTFALEGAVSVAGQCVRWLRDNLKFFDEASQIGKQLTANYLIKSAVTSDL